MLQRLAEDISFYLIVNKIIDIEERDNYIYGLQLVISSLFTSVTILILGFIMGEFISSIIFLSVYFFLKSYTGGYHAKRYYECYIYSIVIYIFLLIIRNMTLDIYKPIVGLLALIFSTITIFKFSPVENKNNPKTQEELVKNKKIARSRTIFLNIIIILGYIVANRFINSLFMLSMTEFSIAYLILKQKFLERRQLS
ncbi:accessory gene regulator B family protein [Tissierella sp. MSJ-40]|uniref:Accessory gene regulator B family protein n=1 Tax=Tissierella simiarum TaxID=2841534 RepID=A0ABS6E8N3_9FIRM|nr:accessory gene regulator B family protein [Tissierella simiarum]MBU5438790.1 accessory gene regulator B family protein [Tissierella simiarum]